MPRNITLTFDDGSRHTYQNVPDTVTPDQVEARAASEFGGRRLVDINGGKGSAVDLIPTAQAPGVQTPAAVAPPAPTDDPTLMQRAVGAGEAGLTVLTGATGGALGMLGGTLKGLAEQILSGQFGTQQAADLVEQSATQGAQALTYAPRTPEGQRQAGIVGEAMQAALPVMPLTGELATIGRAAAASNRAPASVMARAGAEGTARDVASAAVRPAEAARVMAPGAAAAAGDAAAGGVAAVGGAVAKGADRVAALSRTATTLPRRALEQLRRSEPDAPTPGTMGSGGAAGTDIAAQRRATAELMPVPLKLTKGQATRNAAQLKFEVESAKIPEIGGPLRERRVQQNEQILQNFDWAVDQTGAQAPTLRAVGAAVDKALTEKYARDKAEVRVKYTAAEKSPEAAATVDPAQVVSIGEGEGAITASPVAYLNSKPTGLPTTALLDHARAYAKKLGIVEEVDGELIGRPTTIKAMEDWRREINRATGYEPTDVRESTVLKAMIDSQTEPVAGPLYRQARTARARLAQQYEDRAVIAKLLTNKRGMGDRQVAFEDVFQHSILRGSLDDVRHVRRVLQTGGPDGVQAWKELQGATLDHIRTKATASVATDSAGRRVLSPDALNKAIRELDVDGRLEFIFGKQGAQFMRDLNDIAQFSKTVPPESAINNSNTAMTLLAAAGDVGFSGMSGIPAPVISLARYARQNMRDATMKRRITDALNDVQRQAPDRRGSTSPEQFPGATDAQTFH